MRSEGNDSECPWCGDDHADSECPTANPVAIGQEVAGRYRVERRLGSGGMGVVYEARHTTLGRRFALKFLAPKYASDARAIRRFENEARAAGRLEHPNVVAIVDVGRDGGALFFAMEYLDGEDCGRLLRRLGPLPVQRAVDIVAQACRGLAAAHAEGLVHRDLKPENIFVSRMGDGTDHVDVLDFGVAKLRAGELSVATTAGGTPGTAYYMAPEQARGDATIDARADVYALGVVLFQLLTGRRPFEGDSFLKVAFEILRTDPPAIESLRDGLPPELAAIVRRAMAKDRDARFASASDLARALARFGYAREAVEQTRADGGDLETAPSNTVPTGVHAMVTSARHSPRSRGVDSRRMGLGLALLAGVAALFLALRRGSETTTPAAATAPSTTSSASSPAAVIAGPTSAAPTPPAPPAASLASTSPSTATASTSRLASPPAKPRPSASATPTAKRGAVHIETSDPYGAP